MDVSIIIVNYKSWVALSELLEGISGFETSRFLMETIVVDNCSNDGKLNEFKKQFPKVKFIENSGNNGFSNGCNFGAAAAKGDYLFFLNPDTVVNENSVFELWQTAKNNPDYGIVTCRQLDEAGKIYNEIRFFPSLSTLFGSYRILYKFFNKSDIKIDFDPQKKIIFPDWVTGAVVFTSRKWFEKSNGWNEKYWLYFEDVDFCKRIKNAGGKVALTRTTSILHKHGGASRINVKTKALTKTEVLISQHVYFEENSVGLKRFFIQFLLILSLLFKKTLLAILGLLFFFIPKMKVNVLIYKNLISYYFSALFNSTFTSPRATLYKKHS